MLFARLREKWIQFTSDTGEENILSEPTLLENYDSMDESDTTENPVFFLLIPKKSRGSYKIPIFESDIPSSLDYDENLIQIFGDNDIKLEGRTLGGGGDRCNCCGDFDTADSISVVEFLNKEKVTTNHQESKQTSVRLCFDCFKYLDNTAIELLVEEHSEYMLAQQI